MYIVCLVRSWFNLHVICFFRLVTKSQLPLNTSVATAGLKSADTLKSNPGSHLISPAPKIAPKPKKTQAKSESNATNFVSPRKVLTSRPSFAKKHSLPTHTSNSPYSPVTQSSTYEKSKSTHLRHSSSRNNSAMADELKRLFSRDAYLHDNSDAFSQRLKDDQLSNYSPRPTGENQKTFTSDIASFKRSPSFTGQFRPVTASPDQFKPVSSSANQSQARPATSYFPVDETSTATTNQQAAGMSFVFC